MIIIIFYVYVSETVVFYHFIDMGIGEAVFNPRPLPPKGYCRHLMRLSVRPSACLSVPIILVDTKTQSIYPINPPNLLGGFNMALSWMAF